MLYPKNIETKLGFDKIRQLLEDHCISSLGQQYIEKIRFSDDPILIAKLVQQTDEFKNILQFDDPFPSQDFIDAKPYLQKAQIEGAFLSEEELFSIKLSLRAIAECIAYIKNRAEKYPILHELIIHVSLEKTLIDQINRVIDERGRVRDNASAALQEIRRALINEQATLRKRSEQILKMAQQQGWTGENTALTVRGGRVVIPLAAEHKRKIKGFVQDESSSGQTVFLEPAEILDLNNAIREWENKERREIIRILTELTALFRPHIPALLKGYQFLAMTDFIQAKAKLAISLQAIRPDFETYAQIKWKQAAHPLLKLSLAAQNKNITPLSIELDTSKHILVVSGPNAGGKSVALKTVGLIQYMFQCGLLVPLKEGSKMGVFKNIFIDIGDEQSLENDLSTYSSHLTNMRHFVNFADANTLFLIDEFGTGTEPRLGGAIAEAILEILAEAKSFGVVNTHYGNLKAFAQNHPFIQNGAMRFDVEKLEPLYELETGQAGSSFAFEIAQKIGLPKKVLARAKEKLGDKEINFDQLLKELEKEKKEVSEKKDLLTQQEKEYSKLLGQYQELNQYLQNEQKKILNQAKLKAKELLSSTNQKIENTIREIKEQQAEKQSTKKLREELETFEQESLSLESIEEELPENEEWEKLDGPIEIGDAVRIKGQTTIGEVIGLRGKDIEILIGDLKSNIKLNRLEKISKKALRQQKRGSGKTKIASLTEKMANFSYQLDLRGMRAEEALVTLDKFLDDAILANYPELRILHGKGDGILRRFIRDHLKTYKEVASFADEHADRGGAGITIVKMK